MKKCKAGSLVPASDGLPARCVGPWSRDKLAYIEEYLNLFSVAMRNRFPIRHYVDLFAGPGRCVVDDGSGECRGSPLLAFSVQYPFARYHLVEADHGAMQSLMSRIQKDYPNLLDRVTFYEGDANDRVVEISAALPANALSVVVVDPTGLHLKFANLQKLVGGSRRADLLYLFPEGMSIKRNERKFRQQSESPLDDVMGDRGWRETKGPRLAYFQERLRTLGYGVPAVSAIKGQAVMKNRKNAPLYFLIYACKNRRGEEFWQAVRRAVEKSQPEFDFPPQ